MARRTRSGTFVGPGICRKWRPEVISRSLYVQSRGRWLCRSTAEGESDCHRASPCPPFLELRSFRSLMKLDAAVEPCSTGGVCVAQASAEGADTRCAVNCAGLDLV